MRTRTHVVTGLVVTSALSLATIAPASAGTAEAATDSWAMDMTVANHTWNYAVPICEEIPVQIETDGWGARSWTLDASVRNASTSERVETLTFSGDVDDPQVAGDDETVDGYVWETSVDLCPADTPGTYVVEGTASYGTAEDYASGAHGTRSATLATTFTLKRMPSTTTVSVKANGTADAVSGRVLGNSPTQGRLDVQTGQVTIQRYTNGAWRSVGTATTNPSGYFSKSVSAVSPKVPYRAVFIGTQKVAGSTSPTATAKPTVTAKPIGNHSKLSVDVNPNKGSGSWTFQVQKKVGDTWVPKKSYKTKGTKETRTVNLPKGTYRVKVTAKYGYGTAYSSPVTLLR